MEKRWCAAPYIWQNTPPGKPNQSRDVLGTISWGRMQCRSGRQHVGGGGRRCCRLRRWQVRRSWASDHRAWSRRGRARVRHETSNPKEPTTEGQWRRRRQGSWEVLWGSESGSKACRRNSTGEVEEGVIWREDGGGDGKRMSPSASLMVYGLGLCLLSWAGITRLDEVRWFLYFGLKLLSKTSICPSG